MRFAVALVAGAAATLCGVAAQAATVIHARRRNDGVYD